MLVTIVEIYLLFSLGCFTIDQCMDIYVKKRLQKEGFEFDYGPTVPVEVALSLLINLIPGLNFKIAYKILKQSEEVYQARKSDYITLGLIHKKAEQGKSENEEPKDSETFQGEIVDNIEGLPPELQDILTNFQETMEKNGIPIMIRASFMGSIPEDQTDFLSGIPHIVVGDTRFTQEESEKPFEEMSIGEKLEFLMNQRETIIESTGYVIDEDPQAEEEQKHNL